MKELIVVTVLHVLPQLKLWHWRTTNKSTHTAFGDLYDELDELTDKLVEVWQGIARERVSFEPCPKQDFIDSDEGYLEYLTSYLRDIATAVDSIDGSDNQEALINILDDIRTSVGKAMYLLTLK